MKKVIQSIIGLYFLGMTAVDCAIAQSTPPGYPERDKITNLKGKFQTPPKGYGEVPFYWWMGDTITREHLSWHLDKLKDMHISSLQINYAHSDRGGITYGKTLPSQPAIFTDEWWELFKWFLEEAKKRNMSVSLSDYTLGVGQGSYVDDMLNEDPSLHGSKLQFSRDTIVGGKFSHEYEQLPLSLTAYKLKENGELELPGKELLSCAKNGKVEWNSGWDKMIVSEVRAERVIPSLDPMNPRSGKSYVRHFFQKFEDHVPNSAQSGLNFFFSDELSFNLSGFLWNDTFRAEFQKRKGYDVAPLLDALYMDIGEKTPAVRLDFNDVLVSLSEENFFIPLYNWHNERGLLFGCDHGGRGKDVGEFGDYFRTQRWNQAPGCDQPYIQKDIVKDKVAASISHLYERQRVWLEGFHSSGWSTNTDQLYDAIFANYALGQNILSLHGFYYSTMGGWWEWAPPCNHIHEAYWEEMQPLLTCTERLSYILSQGYHRADVAVLYPVEPVVAGYGDDCVKTAFDAGDYLYRNGFDFDFMDYESLARCKVKNQCLNIAGEHFKVLVIPSMKAIRHSSLEKILEFKRNGGIIINIGERPEATEKGRMTQPVEKLLEAIFNDDSKNNIYQVDNYQQVTEIIDRSMPRDFRVLSGYPVKDIPYFQHRYIDGKDFYFVYNVSKGGECFFRAHGAVTLWNPWDGTIRSISAQRVTKEGTVLYVSQESSDVYVICFDPKGKAQVAEPMAEKQIKERRLLNDEWNFEIVPTLDNTYGDFLLPAYNGKVGAMIYQANYTNDLGREPVMRTFTFGTKMLMLGAVPEIEPEKLLTSLTKDEFMVNVNGVQYTWQPYEFSWRWGVEHDYGHQGWHGLKAKMYDDFIRVGKKVPTWNANEIQRMKEDNGEQNYYFFTRVMTPEEGMYMAEYGEMRPASIYLNGEKTSDVSALKLKKGVNEILLHFSSYGVSRFALRKAEPDIEARTLAETPLRMKFRGDRSLLLFDTRKQADTKGRFTFLSAPGLESLLFSSYGKAKVTVNGVEAKMNVLKTYTDGLMMIRADLPEKQLEPSRVIIKVDEPWGYADGSVIDGPIEQVCSEGIIRIGDWSQIEGLTKYSGGAWYRYHLKVDKPVQGQMMLDLGKVVSTARLKVNGQEVGLRLAAPYVFDISDKVNQGDNLIEVFVINTSGNHYSSTPSRYCGSLESGILGPVRILLTE